MPTGTVSLANIRLSFDPAFIDFSAAGTLPLNHRLRICDSAGKCIVGFTRAAGTGETYTELLDDTGFADNTKWTCNAGWSVAGGKGVKVSDAVGRMIYQTKDIVSGKLYKLSLTVDAITDTMRFRFGSYAGSYFNATVSSYTVSTETASTGLGLQTSAASSTATVDNLSMSSVDTPSATGVTITSTRGGSVYNWTSVEAGFNYNDASGYTYSLIPVNDVLYEDNQYVVLCLKDTPTADVTSTIVYASDYDCNKLSIDKIWHSISAVKLVVSYDATTDDKMMILSGNSVWTFDEAMPNPKSSGYTGDIVLSTLGTGTGASYTLILKLRKYQ